MTRWPLVPLVPLVLLGCAGSLSPSRRPDGGWHLKCGPSLAKCTQQAEDLCKGRGYVVISGFSKRKLYGAELGQSQVEVRESELDIACADRRDELPNVSPAPAPSVWKLPPRTDAPPAEPSGAAPVPPPAAPATVPAPAASASTAPAPSSP